MSRSGLRSTPRSEPFPSTNSGTGFSAPARRFTGSEYRWLRSSVRVPVLISRDLVREKVAKSEITAPASQVSATCSRPTIDESQARCLISAVVGPYSYRVCGLSGNDVGGKSSVQRSQTLGQPSLFTTVALAGVSYDAAANPRQTTAMKMRTRAVITGGHCRTVVL